MSVRTPTQVPIFFLIPLKHLMPEELLSEATTASFQILANLSFINHPIIRLHILRDTDSVVK
jgi:hypothetical protein